MMEFKVLIAMICGIAAISIFTSAASVGIEREKTVAACYEAAKVNVNIKCEVN